MDDIFDMQELMNLCGQNMMTVNQMSAQMGIVVNKVNSLDKGMSLLTDRMDRFELKSEIDSDQEEHLRQAVNRRVAELLHHDPYEFAKYSRRFFARCWSDAKKYGGVAASYKSTKKEIIREHLIILKLGSQMKDALFLKIRLMKQLD